MELENFSAQNQSISAQTFKFRVRKKDEEIEMVEEESQGEQEQELLQNQKSDTQILSINSQISEEDVFDLQAIPKQNQDNEYVYQDREKIELNNDMKEISDMCKKIKLELQAKQQEQEKQNLGNYKGNNSDNRLKNKINLLLNQMNDTYNQISSLKCQVLFKNFLQGCSKILEYIFSSGVFEQYLIQFLKFDIYKFLKEHCMGIGIENISQNSQSVIHYDIEKEQEFQILFDIQRSINIKNKKDENLKQNLELLLRKLDMINNSLCLEWIQKNQLLFKEIKCQFTPQFLKNKNEQKSFELVMEFVKKVKFSYELLDIEQFSFQEVENQLQKLKENIKNWLNKKSVFDILYQNFFNIIHRGQKWDQLLRYLNEEFKISHPTLFSQFQFNKKLLINLYISCCSSNKQMKIYQQLLKQNTIPLIYNKIPVSEFEQSVELENFDELKQVNEHAFMFTDEDSIGIISLGIGQAAIEQIGKSQLLNFVFRTKFIENDNSPFSYQTVDIDFDYSFRPTRNLAIADCCGEMGSKIQSILLKHFNVLVVHVMFNEFYLLFEQLKLLLMKNPGYQMSKNGCFEFIILIRDAPKYIFEGNNIVVMNSINFQDIFGKLIPDNINEKQLKIFEEFLQKQYICFILVQDLTQLQVEQKNNLKNDLRDFLYGKLNEVYSVCRKKTKLYLKPMDMKEIINKLAHSYNQALSFDSYGLECVQNCIKIIKSNKKDFFDQNFLPLRNYHKQLCQLHYQLKKETNQQKIENIQNKIDLLNKNVKQYKLSDILKVFCNTLLRHKNWYQLLVLLSIQIDKISSEQILYLKNEKDDLIKQNQKYNQKIVELKYEKEQVEILKEKQKNLENQIENIQLKVQEQIFSIEILWRELLFYCELNPKSKLDFIVDPLEKLTQSLEYGESFEIIDGDSMKLNQQSLNVISEKMKDNKIFPFAIFGPQSSGKSTLLNYLFGSQFTTSTGRCTRGVYGSFVKIQNMPFDYLLIIDTEGLQDPDKPSDNFDKTIILFIMAMSQLSVINFKGEINQSMKNLIEICIYSLQKIRMNRIRNGQCCLVFNQNPNSKDVSPYQDQINMMQKQILDANPEALAETNLISKKENLFILGSAFEVYSQQKTYFNNLIWGDWEQRIPSDNFAQQCNNLFGKLMKNCREIKTDWNFKEWVKTASDIWNYIDTSYQLVRASSIQELNCEHRLSMAVQNILKDTIQTNTQKIFNQMIQQYQDDNNIKLDFMGQKDLDYAKGEILSKNQAFFGSKIRIAKEKLEQVCEKESIPLNLQNKYEIKLGCELNNIQKDVEIKINKYLLSLNQNNMVQQAINQFFQKMQETSSQIPLDKILELANSKYNASIPNVEQLQEEKHYLYYLRQWSIEKFEKVWGQIMKDLYGNLDLEKIYKFLFQKLQEYCENIQMDISPFNNTIQTIQRLLKNVDEQQNSISEEQNKKIVDYFINNQIHTQKFELFMENWEVSDKFQQNLDAKYLQLQRREQYLDLKQIVEFRIQRRYIEKYELLKNINYNTLAKFIEDSIEKIDYNNEKQSKKEVLQKIIQTLKQFYSFCGFGMTDQFLKYIDTVFYIKAFNGKIMTYNLLSYMSNFKEFKSLKNTPFFQQQQQDNILKNDYFCKICDKFDHQMCKKKFQVKHINEIMEKYFCENCNLNFDKKCNKTFSHLESNVEILNENGKIQGYVCKFCLEQSSTLRIIPNKCDKIQPHKSQCQKLIYCKDCHELKENECQLMSQIPHSCNNQKVELKKIFQKIYNIEALQENPNCFQFNFNEIQYTYQNWFYNQMYGKIKEKVEIYNQYSQIDQNKETRLLELKKFQSQSEEKLIFETKENISIMIKNANQTLQQHSPIKQQILSALNYLQNPDYSEYIGKQKYYISSFSKLALCTLNWRKIFETIISKIQKNLSTNSYKDKSREKKQSQAKETQIAEYSKITMDCSIQQLNIIISEINKDLEYLNLTISSQGQSLLYYFGLCINWKVLCFYYKEIQEEPIKKFENKKKEWQNQFVSRLTNDSKSQTQAIADKILDDYLNHIKTEYSNIEKIQIHEQFTEYYLNSEFNQAKITQIVEKKVFSCKVNQENVENIIIKYVESPIEQLQQVFEERWSDLVESQIAESNQNLKQQIYKSLKQIENYLQNIVQIFQNETDLTEGDYQDRIFITQDLPKFKSLSLDDQKNMYDKMCFKMLDNIFQGEKINRDSEFKFEFEEEQSSIIFKLNQTTFKKNFEIDIPHFELFQYIQWNDSDDKSEQIPMPFYFVKYMLQLIKDYEGQNNNNILTMNNLELTEKMKNRQKASIGCIEQCKCCGKKCEEQNFDLKHQHSCKRHFVRGFKGVLIQNTLSNLSCEQIPFDARIKIVDNNLKKSVIQTWMEISSKNYPGWKYQGNIYIEPIKKYIDINYQNMWERYKNKVCKFYKIYNQNDKLKVQGDVSVHDIICIDSSGSMSNKWDRAKTACMNYLQQLNNSVQFKTKHVSIIRFNDQSEIIYGLNGPQNIKLSDIDKCLVYSLGGTEFGPPIRDALNQIKQYPNYEYYNIILFTDGIAQYPEQEMEDLKKLQQENYALYSKIRFNFCTIQGKDKVLEKIWINFENKGKKLTNLNIDNLEGAFLEILDALEHQINI